MPRNLTKSAPGFARSFTLTAALLAALAIPTGASAQMRALSDPVVGHPDPESLFTSPDPALHRNKQAALHIQRELLKCGEWARAGEWLTDAYIQHNPVAASGLKGVQDYFLNVAKRQPLVPCPALSASDPNAVVAVIAEGAYVTILTRRAVAYDDDKSQNYTTTWFDTWRFIGGKADEHWDPATLPPSAPPQAAAQGSSGGAVEMAQRFADREAIEARMWAYDRSLDNFDAEAYAANFTSDGGFMQTRGHPALQKMITGLVTSQEQRRAAGTAMGKMHHFTMNAWLEFTGAATARYHYYHQTVFGTGGALGSGAAPVIAAAGQGVDDLVKQNGVWLIANRNVAPARAQE